MIIGLKRQYGVYGKRLVALGGSIRRLSKIGFMHQAYDSLHLFFLALHSSGAVEFENGKMVQFLHAILHDNL